MNLTLVRVRADHLDDALPGAGVAARQRVSSHLRRVAMAQVRMKLLVGALALVSAMGAQAQQKQLYVAGYGGSFEQTMRKEIVPAFEAKHGVKVEYVAGNSTDTLAKLQAQKGNQQIDVAIVDDGPMYQAMQLGFCAPIQGLAGGDIHDSAKFKDNKAVARTAIKRV